MAPTSKPLPSSSPRNPTPADQLLLDLFEGRPSALHAPMMQWVTGSKQFRAFVQAYQSKIRKKIKICRTADETYNLYCELRTAWLLLQEPKFAVAYEPHAKTQGRSADYAVRFTTQMTFHVEVTRLRLSQPEQQLDRPAESAGVPGLEEPTGFLRRYEGRRLADVVCDKCRQLALDTPNVLWVWGESRVLHALNVGQIMADLKLGVEQSDAELFARHGFAKPADFMRYYQRLSAVVIQSLHTPAVNQFPLWWQNNDARHPIPAKVTNRLRALLEANTPTALPGNQVDNAQGT